jgi:hypothetical protein
MSKRRRCIIKAKSHAVSPTPAQRRSFFSYVAVVAAAYLIGPGLVVAMLTNPTLIDVVTACKLGSLLSIIWVNGEIAHQIDKSRSTIRRTNLIFLGAISLLSVALLGKLLHYQPASPFFGQVAEVVYRNLWWLASFPLVAYGALNLYVAYAMESDRTEAAAAERFLVGVYVICVVPLLVVFLFLYFFARYLHEPFIEVFISGSMAIVLLASSFATKAVDTYFAVRD